MSAAPNELLLLDTSVLIHLARNDDVAYRVDTAFQIRRRIDPPLISIVTVGECISCARQFGWGEQRIDILDALLRELVIVNIDSHTVLHRYGELHAWTRSIGRTLGQNDLWIAATAAATGARLITTDLDFAPLADDRIRCTVIAQTH